MSVISKSNLIPDGFIMGVHLAGVLGLRSDYFTTAKREDKEVNAEIVTIHDKFTYVKLDHEVMERLAMGYVCCKIKANEVNDYEFVFRLSRKCIIGMWK